MGYLLPDPPRPAGHRPGCVCRTCHHCREFNRLRIIECKIALAAFAAAAALAVVVLCLAAAGRL
jgi:hypothetical protein